MNPTQMVGDRIPDSAEIGRSASRGVREARELKQAILVGEPDRGEPERVDGEVVESTRSTA